MFYRSAENAGFREENQLQRRGARGGEREREPFLLFLWWALESKWQKRQEIHSVCVCVLWIHMHVIIDAYVFGGRRLVLGVFLSIHLFCWERVSLWTGSSLTAQTRRSANLGALPVSALPVLESQMHYHYQCFTWCWASKLRSSCVHGKHFTDWAISWAPRSLSCATLKHCSFKRTFLSLHWVKSRYSRIWIC